MLLYARVCRGLPLLISTSSELPFTRSPPSFTASLVSLALLLNRSTHDTSSVLTPPSCLLHTACLPSSCQTSPSHPASVSTDALPLPSPPTEPRRRLRTREGDVEPLQRDGEVRDEAELGLEVPVQAGVDRSRPLRAGEPSQRLGEAAVLCYQEVVVMVLQVEGMEGELDTWEEGEWKLYITGYNK